MSALSQNLHQSIRRALNVARDHHHSDATPEHLLFALTDDPEAAPVLLACDVDLAKLRDNLTSSMSRASTYVQSSVERPRPDTAFQSVIQRAVRHIHSVDQDTVTAAHALVSLFADPVAQLLQDQGMTRYDAVSYVCHGIVKHSGKPTANRRTREARNLRLSRLHAPYEVVLLNDEYTTMAFVVCVLQEVFHFTYDEAMGIMFSVHKNGSGSCGYYGRREAEDLTGRVTDQAREAQHPLRCIVRSAARSDDLVRIVAGAVIMVLPRDYLPRWFERVSGW
jgi:ATP-dependent Clp protease adapter protein ClpS